MKDKGEVLPVLHQVPRHEDIRCLTSTTPLWRKGEWRYSSVPPPLYSRYPSDGWVPDPVWMRWRR